MTHVLFVDSNQQVLEGIEDVLRKYRRCYTLHFADSEQAAEAILAEHPIEVAFVELRLASRNAGCLLERLKRERPEIVRVAVSGETTRDAVIRANLVAQRALSKPCSSTELRATLERCAALSERLRAQGLSALVGQMPDLPSMPRVLAEFRELAARTGDVSVRQVSSLVERDPGMAARVLKLANSPYFGVRRPFTNIADAVSYLGLELVFALALSSFTTDALATGDLPEELDIDALQERAQRAAKCAYDAADAESKKDAFSAALLCDVGQLVLGRLRRDAYGTVLAAAARGDEPLHALERAAFGVSHAELGAYLLATWGLPGALIEGVLFHHELPEFAREGELVTTVHRAWAEIEGLPPQPIDVNSPDSPPRNVRPSKRIDRHDQSSGTHTPHSPSHPVRG